ncbi:hypothetical protein FRC17_004939, partial [Serendipita sp. 399]
LNVENTHLLAWAFTKFWAVDVVPFLRYIPESFPGASFKRLAKIGGDQTSRIRYWAFGAIKDAVAKGTADESLVAKNLNDAVFAEPTIRDATAIMYSAGVDTTTTSIINMFYNLVLHPEWQVKLQKELDEVVGRGNLPTAQEIPKLKLFNAAWKESLRLHPPGPLGIPHVNTEADVYKGLYIPKGSIIHCNIGWMQRDPRIWGEDGDQFNPNRFLPEFNPNSQSLPDVSTTPFGFGRRLCPGRFLAERVARQVVASVLSMYTLVPVEGSPVTTTMLFDDSVIRRPTGFKCHFKPRVD